VAKFGSIIDDTLITDVGTGEGAVVAVPGRALSSDPGCRRSINLGDCPERLGPGERFVGIGSSNKLLKLLVTWSGSKRGRGNSLIYGGVLMSNIGGWSNSMSDRSLVNRGGVGLAWKNESCMDISSASISWADVVSDAEGLATRVGSGGLLAIESTDRQYNSSSI
jgi:hypothetical protein